MRTPRNPGDVARGPGHHGRMDADTVRDGLLQAVAVAPFSGAVLVEQDGDVVLAQGLGLADRRSGTPNEVTTRFGVASGTKLLTALVVVSLVEQGRLALTTPAREVLGPDLPLIDDDVTVEQLLCHRSGIGDYLDETLYADIADFELPVPAQRLSTTAAYLEVLDGHAMASAPGERFDYNNGAYVVLALIADRVGGEPFYALVDRVVCSPAGMVSTAFLRSDELPGGVALGYLDHDGLRTNVFHLPVRGSGDGGVYTTAPDVSRLWRSFLDGRIVAPSSVDLMLAPRRAEPDADLDYGLGVWLHHDGVLEIHGYDVGVSFRSLHHRGTRTTCTALANTGDGVGVIDDLLDTWVRS